tara:strand:+ start:397 stop:594 length:198 start_codon:yes stop_codon:yes gene_type:complete
MVKLKNKVREGIKLGGVEYESFQFNNGSKVLVGVSGVLGHDNQLISWVELEILANKYNKKNDTNV